MPWKIPTAAAWQKFHRDQFHGSQMVSGPDSLDVVSFLMIDLTGSVFLLDYDVNFP
jgi:hypothetical protein